MSEEKKMIQSHMVLPFLNDGTPDMPKFIQLKKATEWNTAFNAETEDRKYISDKYATTEVLRYKPSVPVSISTIKGEPDFDLFDKIRKTMPTGEQCKKQLLVVRLGVDEEYDESKDYEAQLANVTLGSSNINAVAVPVDNSLTIEHKSIMGVEQPVLKLEKRNERAYYVLLSGLQLYYLTNERAICMLSEKAE